MIGVRLALLWVCQERVDALPRTLQPQELANIEILHQLDSVSYEEEDLMFRGRRFQRSLGTLNKFTLYYGQKVLLRSGPLSGAIGIILGSDLDVMYMLNITSKLICEVPGRSRGDIFGKLKPLLLGCVLDLSVFEPISPTLYRAKARK